MFSATAPGAPRGPPGPLVWEDGGVPSRPLEGQYHGPMPGELPWLLTDEAHWVTGRGHRLGRRLVGPGRRLSTWP